MEDVDAASEIVQRRDADPLSARTTKTTVEVSRPDPAGSGGVLTEKVTREVSSAGKEPSLPCLTPQGRASRGVSALRESP